MRTITQELSRGKEQFFHLANHRDSDHGGDPFNIRATTEKFSAFIPTDVTRIKKSELELAYMKNPLIFNSINKLVQTIMSARHYFKAKDPAVKAWFDKFAESIGNSGSDITWDELLTYIFKYLCIYGDVHIENVYNKRGTRIVDWDLIDPKRIDYAKNSDQQVVFDENNKPLGYTLILPGNVQLPHGLTRDTPSSVSLPGNGFFIPADKIAHLKLYTVGDGIYPIGLIEPIYPTSLRKLNIEEALANAIYRHGFPTYHAKLGDLNHTPTPAQIKNMLDMLKDVNFRQELVTPYYYDLSILESKKSEKLKEHLEYYKEQEIAGLGMPRPYATGTGSNENRSVLDNMSNLFQLTLTDLIKTTTAAIRKYMLAPIAKLEGFNEVPELEWEIVGVDQLDRKADRLIKYVNAGILSASDPKIAEFVREVEKLN